MTRVYHRERAVGVDARLLAFLDWWDTHGSHDIVVDPAGGLRTDEAKQAGFYARKVSKARTLAETPHGRGAAIDCHPCTVVKGVVTKVRYEDRAAYVTYGKAGEAQGLAWGGHFQNGFDGPHLEVPRWGELPFPPKKENES